MKNLDSKNFFWGVNNIGYQTEGDNYASNWYRWGRRSLIPESGRANNYWNEFKRDHDLVEELGADALRISLEWSRIEPEEGVFDIEAVNHYREILADLKKRNIRAVVGLWHWSVPMWFEEKYGMHHKKAPEIFLNYAHFVIKSLGNLVDILIVLNEPMVFVGMCYIKGEHPPFYRSIMRARRVVKNLILIHKEVYQLVHKYSKNILVGSAHLANFYYPASPKSSLNYFLEIMALQVSKWFRFDYLLRKIGNYQDFIGINYYRKSAIKFGWSTLRFKEVDNPHDPEGWRKFPEGAHESIREIYRNYGKPLIILENGKPTDCILKDENRGEFIQETLKYLKKAKNDGVDLRGYFYYSLTDAYEWTGGYDYFFGLVQIDRQTLARKKRDSFFVYQNIIKKINL